LRSDEDKGRSSTQCRQKQKKEPGRQTRTKRTGAGDTLRRRQKGKASMKADRRAQKYPTSSRKQRGQFEKKQVHNTLRQRVKEKRMCMKTREKVKGCIAGKAIKNMRHARTSPLTTAKQSSEQTLDRGSNAQVETRQEGL